MEVLAELKRPQARAHAAELQLRLEHTYGKRRRLVEVARGRLHEICERLQEGELLQQPPPQLPMSPTLIALPPLRPVFLDASLHASFPSDFGNEQ